jgi:DNA-directed RNA polymerase subunit RPC12/RpoP
MSDKRVNKFRRPTVDVVPVDAKVFSLYASKARMALKPTETKAPIGQRQILGAVSGVLDANTHEMIYICSFCSQCVQLLRKLTDRSGKSQSHERGRGWRICADCGAYRFDQPLGAGAASPRRS